MKWESKHSQPLRTWWDWHPDRTPNDFGVPERPRYTKEEWEQRKKEDPTAGKERWEIEDLDDTLNDLIPW